MKHLSQERVIYHRWGLNPRLPRWEESALTKQLTRQLLGERLRKQFLLQSSSLNHYYLNHILVVSTGGADGNVVETGAGVAGSSPTKINFYIAPLSLLLENLRGVIPGYTEKCASRWDYE